MAVICRVVFVSCQLVELATKVVFFFLTCNGVLTKLMSKNLQNCTSVTRYALTLSKCCQRQSWRCGLRLTVRNGLKVAIRCCHGLLTLAITSVLLYYKTGLRAAVYNYDLLYCGSFFSLLIFSLATYYISCLCDPGYVPIPVRGRCNTFDKVEKAESLAVVETKDMLITKTPLRNCGFCGITQPLRTRHCEDCNMCVRRFDHHCPWLDTCIGEANHRFFLSFIISKTLLTVWASAIIIGSLGAEAEWDAWLRANWVLLLSLCVTLLVAVVLSLLSSFHTYLMATNLTTWECVSRERIPYLKYLGDELNPFHQGYLHNIYNFLFSGAHQRWDLIYHSNTSDVDNGVVGGQKESFP